MMIMCRVQGVCQEGEELLHSVSASPLPLQPSALSGDIAYSYDWIAFPGQSSDMEKHDKELRNVRMSPAVSFSWSMNWACLKNSPSRIVHTSNFGLMEKIGLRGWFDLSLPQYDLSFGLKVTSYA